MQNKEHLWWKMYGKVSAVHNSMQNWEMIIYFILGGGMHTVWKLSDLKCTWIVRVHAFSVIIWFQLGGVGGVGDDFNGVVLGVSKGCVGLSERRKSTYAKVLNKNYKGKSKLIRGCMNMLWFIVLFHSVIDPLSLVITGESIIQVKFSN